MNLLSKTKETLVPRLINLPIILFGLLTLSIGRKIGPRLLSAVYDLVQQEILPELLGMLCLTVIVQFALIIILHQKLKTKLRPKFHILWDRKGNPHCPYCEKLLQIDSKPIYGKKANGQMARTHFYVCKNCDREFRPQDGQGNFLSPFEIRNFL